MGPFIVIALVSGVVSAAAGFFTRVALKRTTHLEDENKTLKAQVATLVDTNTPNQEKDV